MARRNDDARLQAAIEANTFLEIDDTEQRGRGFGVADARSGLCVVVEDTEQLADLVKHGAEWYLNSRHNGVDTAAGPTLAKISLSDIKRELIRRARVAGEAGNPLVSEALANASNRVASAIHHLVLQHRTPGDR